MIDTQEINKVKVQRLHYRDEMLGVWHVYTALFICCCMISALPTMALTIGERVQHCLLVLVPRLFLALFRLFLALFRLVSPGSKRPKHLPPIRNPLLTLSAVQLAEKIRRREVWAFIYISSVMAEH